jgi:glycosyltransferase involved in cell wall biosynthesis
MVALYRSRYPEIAPARFICLPNGFDSDDWRRADLAAGDGTRATGDRDAPKRFVLLHAGQLAHRPTVRTLLDAARLLLDRDPRARAELLLRFVGGNEEIGSRERSLYGLGEALELLPSQPHIESLVSMRRAAALALLGHGGSADSLLYTGKLYEYLSSGRPVLAILDDGPAAQLIRSAGAGSVIRPGDAEGVAAILLEWLQAWRAGKGPSAPVSPALLDGWERRNMAARASEILSEIASTQPR